MSDFKKIKIRIINLGFNNTFSIFQAFKSLGCKVELSNKISKKNFDLLILPGVGSFVEGMNSLKNKILIIILKIMYTPIKNSRNMFGYAIIF